MKNLLRIKNFPRPIVFIGFLLFVANCNESINPPIEQSPDYFPLELGNSWTYVPADTFYGLPFDWEITNRDDDTVTVTRQNQFGSHGGTIRILDRGEEIDLILNNQLVVPYYRFSVGSTWLHHDTWECDDTSTYIAFAEKDQITTPAGTFSNCIRIERRGTIPCVDAGTLVEWWAPNVGLVRWDEENFYVGGPLTIYLKSYKLK